MFPSFNPDKTYFQHQKDGFRSMVMIASGAVHNSINTYPDYTIRLITLGSGRIYCTTHYHLV